MQPISHNTVTADMAVLPATTQRVQEVTNEICLIK